MILTTAAAAIGITILGCGNQEKVCDLVFQSTAQYQTEAACEAAIPATLIKVEEAQYPVLLAQCEAPVETAVIIPHQPQLPRIAPIVHIEPESASLTGAVKSIVSAPYHYVSDKASATVETIGAITRYEQAEAKLKATLASIGGATKATYAMVEGIIMPLGGE